MRGFPRHGRRRKPVRRGPDRRLGRTIEVPSLICLQRDPLGQRRGHGLAGRDRHPHAGKVRHFPEHQGPNRWPHLDHRDFEGSNILRELSGVEPDRAIAQQQTPAADQRQKYLRDGNVETDRRSGEVAVRRGELEQVARGEEQVDHVLVHDLDALRLARAAGREENIGESLAAGCRGRERRRRAVRAGLVDLDELERRDLRLSVERETQGGKCRRITQHHRAARARQDASVAIGRIVGIERHVRQARVHHRQQYGHHPGGTGHEDAHGLFGREPLLHQQSPKRGQPLRQHGVGGRARPIEDRGCTWRRERLPHEKVGHVGVAPLGEGGARRRFRHRAEAVATGCRRTPNWVAGSQ